MTDAADRIARLRDWATNPNFTLNGFWPADVLAICDECEVLAVELAELREAVAEMKPEGWEAEAERLKRELDALAARCTLSDEETEAVRRWLRAHPAPGDSNVTEAVLRRLVEGSPDA